MEIAMFIVKLVGMSAAFMGCLAVAMFAIDRMWPPDILGARFMADKYKRANRDERISSRIERLQLWLDRHGIEITSPFGRVLDAIYNIAWKIERRMFSIAERRDENRGGT